MSNLPQIPGATCCGSALSAPGWTPSPTDTSHNHDDRYPTMGQVDCSANAGRGLIMGNPPTSVCVNCAEVAGYAYSTDPAKRPVFEIVGAAQGGVGPFASPTVNSVVVSGEKVTVTWGPTDNEAMISLSAIAAAVAADPQAAALIRIAVCDCDAYAVFTEGEIYVGEPMLYVGEFGVLDPNSSIPARPSSVGKASDGDFWIKVEGTDSDGWRKMIIAEEDGSIAGIFQLADATDTVLPANQMARDAGGIAVVGDGATMGGKWVSKFRPVAYKPGGTVLSGVPFVLAEWHVSKSRFSDGMDIDWGFDLMWYLTTGGLAAGFSLAMTVEDNVGGVAPAIPGLGILGSAILTTTAEFYTLPNFGGNIDVNTVGRVRVDLADDGAGLLEAGLVNNRLGSSMSTLPHLTLQQGFPNIKFTANDPGNAETDDVTIADGSAPTNAELLKAVDMLAKSSQIGRAYKTTAADTTARINPAEKCVVRLIGGISAEPVTELRVYGNAYLNI